MILQKIQAAEEDILRYRRRSLYSERKQEQRSSAREEKRPNAGFKAEPTGHERRLEKEKGLDTAGIELRTTRPVEGVYNSLSRPISEDGDKLAQNPFLAFYQRWPWFAPNILCSIFGYHLSTQSSILLFFFLPDLFSGGYHYGFLFFSGLIWTLYGLFLESGACAIVRISRADNIHNAPLNLHLRIYSRHFHTPPAILLQKRECEPFMRLPCLPLELVSILQSIT